VSKLATAFVTANSSGPDNGDDGTWREWDWELSWDEFQEALVRIVSAVSVPFCALWCVWYSYACELGWVLGSGC
jgi:hypothetical protein